MDTEKRANVLQRQETEEGCGSRWVSMWLTVHTAEGFSANMDQVKQIHLIAMIARHSHDSLDLSHSLFRLAIWQSKKAATYSLTYSLLVRKCPLVARVFEYFECIRSY